MPAILSLSIAAASPVARLFKAVAAGATRLFQRVARALKNRRDAGMLSGLDDRMLADIGLTRGDLRDAYAEPLWHDPTDVLARRSAERRTSRRRAAFDSSGEKTRAPGSDCLRQPPADRPARYLM